MTGITVYMLTSLLITGVSLINFTISQRSARPTIQRLGKDAYRHASTRTPLSRDCIIRTSIRLMSASISIGEGKTVKSLLFAHLFTKSKRSDTFHLAISFTYSTDFTSQFLTITWLRVLICFCLNYPKWLRRNSDSFKESQSNSSKDKLMLHQHLQRILPISLRLAHTIPPVIQSSVSSQDWASSQKLSHQVTRKLPLIIS